ncbi:carbonic anhydrase [Govanella unica]|uniref:Carbonic anhydrase n=1 Tax=Govanella unica TaxID=2975056 RepID=A0A9X3TZN8_9PROT|nr:carbonic anhydrase [Govania unica]MDA5194930.1 carbonic anhydrase [Govania unica]
MLKDLIDGYRRYRLGWSEVERDLYRQLVENGQEPKVMVVACCDSRVDPSIILDAKPGSLFMARNIANLIPPFEKSGSYHGTSAALEYAVRSLKVEHIIVLGHAHCGGIRALHEGTAGLSDFVGGWMEIVRAARDHVHANCSHERQSVQRRMLEEEAIRVSLHNLMTFPWIEEQVGLGALQLHGWHYGLAEGELSALDPDSNEFRSLLEDQ